MKNLIIICLILLPALGNAQTKLYTEQEHKKLLADLATSKQELLNAVKNLSETQFRFRPDSKTWSANDIVEHLGLVEEGYVRELWFSLAQPRYSDAYLDSTKGGDERAIAYATSETKGEARGTNLPRNRFCDKATCVRIFAETDDLVADFYVKNEKSDLRRIYIFRGKANGAHEVRDLHQFGLWLLAHRIRHTHQLKRVLADPAFPSK